MNLADHLKETFGFAGDVAVAPGPRGAMGRIWRVTAGGAGYALKETFFDPPTEAMVDAEVAFVRRAVAAGVRAPLTRPDRTGRHLVSGPDGGWLRLYDWFDLVPLPLDGPDTPRLVGELLARLHSATTPASVEVGGGPLDPWYERPPDVAQFAALLDCGAPWVPRLAARVATLPRLVRLVTPVDPSRLVLCHRDLHPGNVLADGTGTPVVLDWDNLGPADPSRELAHALFDWWCDPEPDTPAMRAMYDAYVRLGGSGRVNRPADFTTLVCVRLNFLLLQCRAALDEQLDPEHRAWAEQEIDEALRIFPTPEQIAEVVALLNQASGEWVG